MRLLTFPPVMGESYRPMRKLKRSGGQVAQRISASPRAARRARVHRRDPRKSSSDAAASASRGVARVERPAKPAVCGALRPAGMRGRAAHPAPRAATQQAPSPASARPRTYIDARRFLILQSRYARCARFVRVASCLGPPSEARGEHRVLRERGELGVPNGLGRLRHRLGAAVGAS